MTDIEKVDLGNVKGTDGIGIKTIIKSEETDPTNPLIDIYDIILEDNSIYQFHVKNAFPYETTDHIDLEDTEKVPLASALLDYLSNYYTRNETDDKFQEQNIVQSITANTQSTEKYPSILAIEEYTNDKYYTKAETDDLLGIAREIINE